MRFLPVIIAFLLLIAFAVCAMLVGGVNRPPPSPEKTQRERERVMMSKFIDEITYLRDPRTNLCFAHAWRGGGYGGPALASVPCDTIPADLLTASKVEEEK